LGWIGGAGTLGTIAFRVITLPVSRRASQMSWLCSVVTLQGTCGVWKITTITVAQTETLISKRSLFSSPEITQKNSSGSPVSRNFFNASEVP